MLHSPLGDTGEIPNCTGARAHPPLRDATDRSLALAEVVLPGMIALDEITKSYNGRRRSAASRSESTVASSCT